jgi:predicted helicase
MDSLQKWIMERYQVTTDKDSGVVNNPNEWSEDPRYIFDLLRRVVRVSLDTMEIVNSLPALEESSGVTGFSSDRKLLDATV